VLFPYSFCAALPLEKAHLMEKKRCRRATNGSASSVQADNGAANERCLGGL
jgi:hypothetical protein